MARLNVNPTRMELRRLKTRLKTAERGHKLLKDKSDETIRQFMIYIKENQRLRKEIESELSKALNNFTLASAVNTSQSIEEAVMMPGTEIKIESTEKNVMGVTVPEIKILASQHEDLYPYSFASVTSELDNSISNLSSLWEKLVKLAEIEKTCDMLADEIEKNRRRVNALEYVMIPQLNETIKYIKMKLDENERANTIRLMKVKSMIQKEGK
ncbi:MAG: V-type ATP synthase subunit D [Clostridia bacterium]|nr:V-type ATP synthase subunit D [Clostridia bacterium]